MIDRRTILRASTCCVLLVSGALLFPCGGMTFQAVPATTALPTEVPPLSDAEMEDFLRTAKITDRKTLRTGVTASGRATLIGDKFRHDAHIQTVNEYRARFDSPKGTEFNFKDSWKFNVAAYRLDRLLGLNMTPMSVERMVGGSSASVTWWINDAMMESDRLSKKIEPPDPVHWNKQMYIVRVFDQLIYNLDRNMQNLLITKDWKLWMIDHTRAFRILHALRAPANLTNCDRKLLERLRQLDRPTLDRVMKGYLVAPEISGLLARRDRIIRHFERLVAEKGEGAVLYDFLQ